MGAPGFTVLVRGPGFAAGLYDCAGRDGGEAEAAGGTELVFVHRGAYRVESGRGAVLADAGRLVRLEAGEAYGVRHPVGGGDRSFVLALSREADARLREELGIARRGVPLAVPAGHDLYLRSQRLRAALERRSAHDDALAEDAAALAADAQARFSERRAPETDERTLAVQALLASGRYRAASLAALAAEVGLSPFALARRFRRTVGTSVHQYRLALAVREALERLCDGERDLTALALDLGFADHAHFTRAFGRRFGLPPSAVRDDLARAAPRGRRRRSRTGPPCA